ncbi:MAG: outer membrane protein transport protein [Myxococcota bacterium]
MRMQTILKWGSSALLLALSSTAFATPPDIFGFGARSNALAGAVTADVEDVSANYYNPAGLVHGGGLRLLVQYFNSQPLLEINGQRSTVERHGGLNAGLVAPATFGNVRLAFGLGIHLPDQRVARTRSTIVDRPRWELYDTRSHRILLATNLAVQFASWLRVGAGIAFQSPSELTLDFRGASNAVRPETLSRLEHQFRGDLTSIRYPSAGIQISPHRMIEFGLTYRGQYELSSTLIALANVDITGLGDAIPLRFALNTRSVSLFGPQQLAFGMAFRPIERLRIGFDLTWFDWSKHPSLIAEQDIVLEADIPPALGIEIPDEITALPSLPLGLKDTFVPRLGIEYQAVDTVALEVDIRLGYAYEPTPFPVQRGITNFVDGDKHTVSFGLGFALTDLEPTLPGAVHFDIYANYGRVVPRNHNKDSLVDGVGDYTAGGHLVAAGVGIEVVFE